MLSRVRLSVPSAAACLPACLPAALLANYYTVVRASYQARFSVNANANTARAKQENALPPPSAFELLDCSTALLPSNRPTRSPA